MFGPVFPVPGQPPRRVHEVFEGRQLAPPLLIEVFLVGVDVPAVERVEKDNFRHRHASLGVSVSLIGDPARERAFGLASVAAGETLMGSLELEGFVESVAPLGLGTIGVSCCQCCFVRGPKAWGVLLSDAEVEAHCSLVLVAVVGNFFHGQAGSVHHVPFGMP